MEKGGGEITTHLAGAAVLKGRHRKAQVFFLARIEIYHFASLKVEKEEEENSRPFFALRTFWSVINFRSEEGRFGLEGLFLLAFFLLRLEATGLEE